MSVCSWEEEVHEAASLVEQVYLAAENKQTAYGEAFEIHGIFDSAFGQKELFAQIIILGGCAAIVFRGTIGWHDWIINADTRLTDCPWLTGQCHEGFLRLYQSMSTQIHNVLMDRNIARTLVTGHSLGAALGTLCALDLTKTQSIATPLLITFASPRVFDIKGANAFMKIIPTTARVFNSEDLVPTIPLTMHGYCHVGDNIGFTMGRTDIMLNHSIETYLSVTGTWANAKVAQGAK
jgi:triacylglycerol lipase